MPSRNRAREEAKARERAALEAEGIDLDKKRKAARPKKKQARKNKKNRQAAHDRSADQSASRRTPSKKPRTGPMLDPSASDDSEVRFVMPGDAAKAYICPGCNRDIPPGVGHLVAVPPDAPDLRRHWHRGCWDNRHTRF